MVDDTNPALPIVRKYAIFPTVSGPIMVMQGLNHQLQYAMVHLVATRQKDSAGFELMAQDMGSLGTRETC